jgi:hypothetical protein
MSLWSEARYRVKKAMLVVFGPADLPSDVDPQKRLEREHDAQRDPEPDGKDWDQG